MIGAQLWARNLKQTKDSDEVLNKLIETDYRKLRKLKHGKKENSKSPKQVVALKHEDAKRKNIPTTELQSAAQRMEEIEPAPPVTFKRNKPLAKGETRPCDRLLVSGVKQTSEFFEDMERS